MGSVVPVFCVPASASGAAFLCVGVCVCVCIHRDELPLINYSELTFGVRSVRGCQEEMAVMDSHVCGQIRLHARALSV